MGYQYQGPSYQPGQNGNRNQPPQKGDVGYWVMVALFLVLGAWPVSLIMLLVKLGSDKTIDNTYDRMTGRARSAQQSAARARAAADEAARAARAAAAEASAQAGAGAAAAAAARAAAAAEATAAAQRRAAQKSAAQHRAKNTVLHQPKKGGRVLMVIGAILALVGLLATLEPLSQIISWGVYGYLMEDLLSGLGFLLCGSCMYGAGRKMKKRDRRYQQYLGAIQDQRIVLIKTLASIAGVSQRRVYKDLDEMLSDGLLPKGAFVDRTRQCLVLDAAAMAYETEATASLDLNDTKKAQEAPAPEAAVTPANEYALILTQIRQVNDDIDDEAMSAKIDNIEAITRAIFKIVEEKPERKQEIRNFFNYYLPTTQKLLNFYAQLEAQPVQSETILDSRKNIEGIMDNLVKGFEAQLDSLFKADALDISTDISVLENMLTQDGLRTSNAEEAIAAAAKAQAAGAGAAKGRAPAGPSAQATATMRLELPK